MFNAQTQLNTLQRPKLLIRAARAGMLGFKMERDLRGIKSVSESMDPQQMFDLLLQQEHHLNEERVACDATYNVRKHIRVLTALMVVTTAPNPKQQAA